MASSGSQKNLQEQHRPEEIAARLSAATDHSYLGDFVLGAVDGAVTTFAIVVGVAGAELSSGVALVLGIANLLADGFSMAIGNFLKARADHQIVDRFRIMEENHIDEVPEGEREEIRQIFAGKGFHGDILDEIVRVITKDRRRWIDTMLVEEWGLILEPPSPIRAAWTTFAAFVLVGSVPLIPLFFTGWASANGLYLTSAVATCVAFIVVGVVRGKVIGRSMLVCVTETLLMGGGAALLAYFVGAGLKSLAGA